MCKIIQNRFGKAVKHYDSNAKAQLEICKKLFSYIPAIKPGASILELGCGTGNFSKLLSSLNPSKLLLNDICSEYYMVIKDKMGEIPYTFTSCNASDYIDNLKEQGEKFDLIAAASVIQWIEDPISFLINCKELLKPNGILAINTFTQDNINEVTSITHRGLEYPSIDEYNSILKRYYKVLECYTESIVLNFHTPLEILLHLKLTGVTATSNRTWTREDMRQFESEYIRRYAIKNPNDSNGILCPLTYTPAYIILKTI